MGPDADPAGDAERGADPGRRGTALATAIVVLGAAVGPGGRPSPTLERRARHAAALWHAGAGARVIPTGGRGRHPPSEAEAIAVLLRAEGVADDAILMEDAATTTRDNAVFTARIMARQGLTRALVVTDGYHRPRAWLSFRAAGVAVRTVSASGTAPRARWPVTFRMGLREAAALPVYALQLGADALRHR